MRRVIKVATTTETGSAMTGTREQAVHVTRHNVYGRNTRRRTSARAGLIEMVTAPAEMIGKVGETDVGQRGQQVERGSTRRLHKLVAGFIVFVAAAGLLFLKAPISQGDVIYRTAAIKTVAFSVDGPTFVSDSYPHPSPSPSPRCRPWRCW
jgi:hypothetical protein